VKGRKLMGFALLMALLSDPLGADEAQRFDHYQGEQPADLAAALTLLSDYAQRLEQQLQVQDLDAVALNDIHQLTYTLENALERLAEDVSALAELLESVHVGSETAAAAAVRADGARFLERLAPLLQVR
jgi:hypothetical protein